MISLTRKHWFYYGFLCVVLGFGLMVILLSPGNKELQISTVILMAVFYIVWAIIHHIVDHDMSAKVMLEYILIGMVGIAIVYFVLSSVPN